MTNKELEIIAQGEFIDQGYRIKTLVIRLLGNLHQEELDSHELNSRGCYETEAEWKEYKASKAELKKRFEEKVREMLGFKDSESFVIQNSLSEIFTVVAMFRMEKQ